MSYSIGCPKCKQPLFALEEYVRCDWCRINKYHLSCGSMNAYDARRCKENQNVFWICDDCLPTFHQRRTIAASEISNEGNRKEVSHEVAENSMEITVSQLQSEFAEMKKCVAELKQSFSSSSVLSRASCSTTLSTSTPEENTSRKSVVSSDQSIRPQLCMGSNVRSTSPNRNRKCWMYFTKIAKHVSCEQIAEMVTANLKLNDPPDVTRLIPQWSNLNDLRYVSFKVGVDWRYRETAVLDSTWPVGLMYREFVYRENHYWEP